MKFPKLLGSGMIPANDYYIFGGGRPSSSNTAATPDRIYFLPIRASLSFNAKELGVIVFLAATFAQKLVMGIYDFDFKTGNPINLLYQPTGELSLDGATGYKKFDINFNFDPGIYYIAYHASSGVIVANCNRIIALEEPILPQNTGGQIIDTKYKYLDSVYSSILPSIISSVLVEATDFEVVNPVIGVNVI